MTGPTWAATAPAVFCAVLFCAAVAAWGSPGSNGPGRTRLLLATGADPEPEGRRRSVVQQWSETLRSRVPGDAGRGAGRSSDRSRHGLLRDGRLGRLWARAGRAWWCLPAGGAAGLAGDSVLPVVLGAVSVPLVSRWEHTRRARAEADRRESAVVDLCAGVAGELRGGRMPAGALLAAGAGRLGQEGAALLAAARFGGDVPAVLHRAARLPGADGLRGAAACWQVSADGGAGLADGLDRVAEALRAERDQREELRAQLAGPRSTAVVLALLPVFGLVLGTAMGADPLHVLLHSPVGLGLLTAGLLLEWAGLAWVARLVRAAEEGR